MNQPTVALATLLALALGGCRDGAPPDTRTEQPQPEERAMPDTSEPDRRDAALAAPIPDDPRLARALELPIADDVVVAFAHVAAAKSPRNNYRYELHRDGRLFYVQHSGIPGDWQQPFDRALPAAPSRTLDPAVVAAVIAELDAGGFFDHPGFEANAVEDGSYWIVQARRGGDLESVVFQNVKPPYLSAVTALSDPLWTEDPTHDRAAVPAVLAKGLGALLDGPLAPDVVIAFADLGRTKDGSLDQRWQLTADGRLFVEATGAATGTDGFAPDPAAAPTATLTAAQVAELRAAISDAGFFDHPGYEAVVASGGSMQVVRARRADGDVHTVVLVNVASVIRDRLLAVHHPR